MKKILVVTPFAKDANSFYRGVGPWSYFTKVNRERYAISIAQDDIGHNGVSWDTVGQFDMVAFHRPCRNDDLTILKIARNLNIPVISDFDDDLFSVPTWNPHAHTYANNAMQNIIATMIACSDVVSVSTADLYRKFYPVNKNTVIIPNAYRSDLYPYRGTPKPRQNLIAWRGTNTHDADLLSVLDGIKKLPAKTAFVGGAPWSVLHQMKQDSYQVYSQQDHFLYMKHLCELAPKLLIVPLVDCFFNRCKSNIAYQEALHAGALCVAPDLPEWNREGIINYKPHDSESFLDACNKVMNMGEKEHAEKVELAYKHMLDLYDTTTINQIRESTVFAMLDKEFEKNRRDPYDQLTGLWAMTQLRKVPLEHIPDKTIEAKGLA